MFMYLDLKSFVYTYGLRLEGCVRLLLNDYSFEIAPRRAEGS
jgi:hypothetical protein